LETLAEQIGELANLKSLHLSGNQLSTLPASINKLSGLEELDLWNNKVTSLPQGIGKLSRLRSFKLQSEYLPTIEKEKLSLELLSTQVQRLY
jgi:Leucine-rich repeat (LRR) protein